MRAVRPASQATGNGVQQQPLRSWTTSWGRSSNSPALKLASISVALVLAVVSINSSWYDAAVRPSGPLLCTDCTSSAGAGQMLFFRCVNTM
jgi:hypothetical protein